MFACPVRDAIGTSIERFIPHRFRAAPGEQIHPFDQADVTARTMGALGGLRALRTNGEEFSIEASISHRS
jgi:hypothetical protein